MCDFYILPNNKLISSSGFEQGMNVRKNTKTKRRCSIIYKPKRPQINK